MIFLGERLKRGLKGCTSCCIETFISRLKNNTSTTQISFVQPLLYTLNFNKTFSLKLWLKVDVNLELKTVQWNVRKIKTEFEFMEPLCEHGKMSLNRNHQSDDDERRCWNLIFKMFSFNESVKKLKGTWSTSGKIPTAQPESLYRILSFVKLIWRLKEKKKYLKCKA